MTHLTRRSLLTLAAAAAALPAVAIASVPEPDYTVYSDGKDYYLAPLGKRAPLNIRILDELLEKVDGDKAIGMSPRMTQLLCDAGLLTSAPSSRYALDGTYGIKIVYAYRDHEIIPINWYDFEHIHGGDTVATGGTIDILTPDRAGFHVAASINHIADAPVIV